MFEKAINKVCQGLFYSILATNRRSSAHQLVMVMTGKWKNTPTFMLHLKTGLYEIYAYNQHLNFDYINKIINLPDGQNFY